MIACRIISVEEANTVAGKRNCARSSGPRGPKMRTGRSSPLESAVEGGATYDCEDGLGDARAPGRGTHGGGNLCCHF